MRMGHSPGHRPGHRELNPCIFTFSLIMQTFFFLLNNRHICFVFSGIAFTVNFNLIENNNLFVCFFYFFYCKLIVAFPFIFAC